MEEVVLISYLKDNKLSSTTQYYMKNTSGIKACVGDIGYLKNNCKVKIQEVEIDKTCFDKDTYDNLECIERIDLNNRKEPIEISFHVSDYHKLNTPNTKATTHILITTPDQICGKFDNFRDLNVRKASTINKVFKNMKNTLMVLPKLFNVCHTGITISADTIKYDEFSQTVTLIMSNPEIHGINDGNSSDTNFKLFKKDGVDLTQSDICIRVITGINTKRESIAINCSLNSRNNVKAFTIVESEGYFDKLKEDIEMSPKYIGRISYIQNEEKYANDPMFPITKVLQLLMVMDINKYDKDHHPTSLMNSNDSLLTYLKKNPNGFVSCISRKCSLFLDLFEEIQITLDEFWTSSFLTKKEQLEFENLIEKGKLAGVTYANQNRYYNKDKTSFYYKSSLLLTPMTHSIADSLVMCYMHGFSYLLKIDGRGCLGTKNKVDLIDFWHLHGNKIIRSTLPYLVKLETANTLTQECELLCEKIYSEFVYNFNN